MVEVTFEPGVTSLPVPVTINDDSEIEADEIFTAVLTTSEQDVMIGEDIATVTIIDTDGKNILVLAKFFPPPQSVQNCRIFQMVLSLNLV